MRNTSVWRRSQCRGCSVRSPAAAPSPRSRRFARSCGLPSSTCRGTSWADSWFRTESPFVTRTGRPPTSLRSSRSWDESCVRDGTIDRSHPRPGLRQAGDPGQENPCVHALVVEVKKTDSKELWSAVKEQLIAKYTRDPRSGGYGIYLVLWFGTDHLRRAPPEGARPESPGDVRDRFIGLLPRETRRTITVLVVDVSAPTGRTKRDVVS